MDVVGVPGQVEGRRPVVQVGVGDEAELFEGLESAVDGRGGQGGPAVATDLGSDRVRRGVPEPRERVDDAAPLGRQPHPVGAQHRCQVRHHPTVCRQPPVICPRSPRPRGRLAPPRGAQRRFVEC